MSPFDLDLIHIEQYHSHKMKIRPSQNIILICTTMSNNSELIIVKETRLCISRKKLKKKCNNRLAKYLVLTCKFTHFHSSTAYFLYLLWDRLKICSMANMLNTYRLHSLFELSIKARINYQYRNIENKYSVLSFKE